MKILLAVAGLLAAAAAALLAAVYWRQEALLFAPETLAPDHALGALGDADVREETIEVDGARLDALHLRLPDPRGVVFFLHGNGGNLESWFVDTDFYRRANYDLFMIDYRGYGKSTGRITSEAQLHADVAAAWRRVAPRYAGRRRIFLGRSLGTALAARLAAQEQPDLTVLVSPYWSMTELARLHYPVLPAWLLRYPLETFKDIARIEGPVLILHGDRDTLIPVGQGERLRAAARQGVFVAIEGAGHGDLQDFPAYRDAIAQRLAGL
jgi:pimeloyl-ACP methyl ester carboxylesterase